MKELKIGTYQLGWRWVDVIASLDDTGGSFSALPGSGHDRSEIKIGFGYEDMDRPFAVLFHEALEFLIDEVGCRFAPSSRFIRTSSDVYRFQMDHDEFTDVAAKLSFFIGAIQKDFEAAWQLLKEVK